MKKLRYLAVGAACWMLGAIIAQGIGLALAALTVPEPGFRLVDGNALASAINQMNQMAVSANQTAGAANTQSTCTAIVNPVVQAATSAANGSFCLPTATAGRLVMISNSSGQTINLFGSNQSFTAGTQDTINGTAGSTAYTGTADGDLAICVTVANGAWKCVSPAP